MTNKYLEKIASFDYDAHNSMIDSVKKPGSSAAAGGWTGNMDKFNAVSKRSTLAAAGKSEVKAGGSILKKVLTKFR